LEPVIFAEFLMVGAGGFLGSGLRYVLATSVQRLFSYSDFPYGTLIVNIIGCLFIGYLASVAETRGVIDTALRLFLLAGVLGGFTTFSAFSLENLLLLQDSKVLLAMLNIVVQVVAGLGAAWLGFQLARVF
jgi:CrcB protein